MNAVNSVKYTHKGWFGVCPVYFANLDGEAPNIHQRHDLFLPLFMLSEWVFGIVSFMVYSLNPELQLGWPMLITAEMKAPKVIDHELF